MAEKDFHLLIHGTGLLLLLWTEPILRSMDGWMDGWIEDLFYYFLISLRKKVHHRGRN